MALVFVTGAIFAQTVTVECYEQDIIKSPDCTVCNNPNDYELFTGLIVQTIDAGDTVRKKLVYPYKIKIRLDDVLITDKEAHSVFFDFSMTAQFADSIAFMAWLKNCHFSDTSSGGGSYSWFANGGNDIHPSTEIAAGATVNFTGLNGVVVGLPSSGSNTLNFNGSLLQWYLDADSGTAGLVGDAGSQETVNILGGTGISTAISGLNVTITNTSLNTDAQTLNYSGSAGGPVTLDISGSSDDVTFTAGTNITFNRVGDDLTINSAAPIAYSLSTSGSFVTTLIGSGTTVQFLEGTGIDITFGGTSGAATLTFASTITDTDDQGLTYSGAAGGPVGLDIDGGSDVSISAGTNITFNRVGTNLEISASGGGAGTDLTWTGSGPFNLLSSTGTDVTVSEGANINITRVSNDLEFVAIPSGSTTHVQYNSSGAFAGNSGLTYDGTNAAWTGMLTNSSFNTGNYEFQVGSAYFQGYALNNFWIGENAYFNGSAYTRPATGYASAIQLYGGQVMFWGTNTGSGTFTQTIGGKIDYDGNFGVGSGVTHVTDDFTGASLYHDAGLERTGLGTITPSTALEIESAGPIITLTATSNTTYPGVSIHDATDQLASLQYGGSGVGGALADALIIGARTASGKLLFVSGAGATVRATMLETGEFGIGVSPSQKFHVSGNARITGAVYDSNNDPGSSGQIMSSSVTGWDWINPVVNTDAQTLSVSGGTSPVLNISGASSPISFAFTGGTFTSTSSSITFIATDQSTTNELQTVANTGTGELITTLSNTGGSWNIKLSTGLSGVRSGTSLDGIFTITNTVVDTDTDDQGLTYTGAAGGPVTLAIDGGSDVTMTAGSNIAFNRVGTDLEISATGAGTYSWDIGVNGGSYTTISNAEQVSHTEGANMDVTIAGNVITYNAIPSGSTREIQFNDAGNFGAEPTLYYTTGEVLVSQPSATTTNTDIYTNVAIYGSNTQSTVGTVVSLFGYNTNSGSGSSIGTIGISVGNTGTGKKIGILGRGIDSQSDIIVGGYFDLRNTLDYTVPSFTEEAALITDNGTSDGFILIGKDNGTSTFVIEDGGNVGIFNTNPTQALHVTGNIRVTGAYYDSNNSPGSSGEILSSTATGTDWIAAVVNTDAQNLTFTGSGPFTLDISGGTDVTFEDAGILVITRSANELTFTATEVDGSTSNELDTWDLGANASYTTISNTEQVNFVGAGIAVTSRSTNTITITATEVDGSTTNEIQNLTFSGASSPVSLLIDGGGTDVVFTAGTNVTLSQTGNNLTINSSGGATDLTFTGSGPFNLLSSTGTDVTITEGANIDITRATNDLSFKATPSGSNTEIQFNNSGTFGASANVTYDGSIFEVTGLGNDIILVTGTGSAVQGNSIHLTHTNAAAGIAYIMENNRGSFASYANHFYGGSTNASTLFGENQADKYFIYSAGASNLGMVIGNYTSVPLILGTNNLNRVQIAGSGTVTVSDLNDGTGVAKMVTTTNGLLAYTAIPSGGTTDLTFTGSGPFTLNSSTGTDVTITEGANIDITRATNDLSFKATPSGSNTQIQFNNSGTFGASSNLVWDGTNVSIGGVGTASAFVHTYQNTTNGAVGFIAENAGATASSGVKYLGISQFGSNGFGISILQNSGVIEGYANGGIVLSGYGGNVRVATGSGRTLNTTFKSGGVDIVGDLYVTGRYYDSGNSAGTSGQILSSLGASGTDWIASPSLTATGSGPFTIDISGGSDVTITEGSNIDISRSSNDLTFNAIPASGNTYIQYNGMGLFASEAAFNYNASTNTMTSDKVILGQYAGISALGAVLYVNNDGQIVATMAGAEGSWNRYNSTAEIFQGDFGLQYNSSSTYTNQNVPVYSIQGASLGFIQGINGGVRNSISSSIDVDDDDIYIQVTGSITVGIPASTPNRVIYFTNTGGSTVTLDPASTGTIDGAGTYSLTTGNSVMLVCHAEAAGVSTWWTFFR